MDKILDAIYGYLPDQKQEKIALKISEDGKFISGMPSGDALSPNYLLWDLDRDLRVVPGLINVHVHGGIGITFEENLSQAEDQLRRYSTWVASNGVIGFLCTIAAADQDHLLEEVEVYAGILGKELPGAECLGLHLEGPYLSQEKRGAFNSDWLRNPSLSEIESLIKAGKGWIRQVTMAPELPGAGEAAEYLKRSGVVPAMGHTNADYDFTCNALSTHFEHVTHTYNAMSAFHHFTPASVGAVLVSDNVTAELIADGIHAHPGALKLLYRCLGPDRVVLITDAMAAAGMPDGTYELMGSPVIVKNRKATRLDGGLSGGTSTLNQCVSNMNQLAGVPFSQSLRMASLTPARMLHLDHRLGSLETGKDASFAIVDQEMHIYQTVVRGRVVYDSGEKPSGKP